MKNFELTLTKFLFPKDLPDGKANFRFVVDLRFTNSKGHFTTAHAVMPSLDTFWECDAGRKDRPNYVRHCQDEGCYSKFYMCPIDESPIDDWDRLILHVNAKERKHIHAIQFKVIDVDRKDSWDDMKDFLGGAVGAVTSKVTGVIAGNLPLSLPELLGGADDDVNSFILKKLAGGDKVLFRGSTRLDDTEDIRHNKRCYLIEGCGTEGGYKIGFRLEER